MMKKIISKIVLIALAISTITIRAEKKLVSQPTQEASQPAAPTSKILRKDKPIKVKNEDWGIVKRAANFIVGKTADGFLYTSNFLIDSSIKALDPLLPIGGGPSLAIIGASTSLTSLVALVNKKSASEAAADCAVASLAHVAGANLMCWGTKKYAQNEGAGITAVLIGSGFILGTLFLQLTSKKTVTVNPKDQSIWENMRHYVPTITMSALAAVAATASLIKYSKIQATA